MGKLIAFECRKLFRSISFYVCLAVLAVLCFLTVFSTHSMIQIFVNNLEMDMDTALTLAGATFHLNGRGYLLGALPESQITMLLGIITAIFVCADYRGGTIKNIIGRGFSRFQFLIAKFFAMALTALIYCLAAWGIFFASASMFWGPGSGWGLEDGLRLLVQYLLVMAFVSLFVLFSLLFKRTGPAIALNIMGPSPAGTVLTVIDVFFREESKTRFSDFWLTGAFSSSGLKGAASGLGMMTGVLDMGLKQGDLLQCALVGLFYLVLFTGLCFLLVRKQDI